ncbi:SGNH/GDSL hydrolase family protein [Lentzea kentuckyensis]|uniref:SGNH/GDSL hydrolase family protein n=1 Tax=Lentzea kentuckyensis TaxID=360086 RepID=UPI001B8006E3|nr:SGNH/GDSL hydrolase family protein [Lentzea kentuckyensis]
MRKRVLTLAVLTVLPLLAVAGPASADKPDCAPAKEATASASAAAVKVWLAGDSTMAEPKSSCPVGWGNQFDQLFNNDVTVVNSAVSGRSIQTWLYESNVKNTKDSSGECVVSPKTFHQRWQNMLNPSTGMKAGDYLVIQFGINDGSADCPRHVGRARYKELLALMTKAAKDRGVTPILLTPVSAIKCSGNSAVGTRGFLTETFDAGRAAGAAVIDLHKLSYTLYNTLKFCPNNGDFTKGPVGAFFCNDHTHFEAAGARQIAGVVAKALRDQKIPLSSYLK